MYRVLLYLHAFVGVGALFGGLGAVLNPNEPMGITVDALKYGPFNNFLIPGLFLMIVMGIGNIITAYLIHKQSNYRVHASFISGWILVSWIAIQCIILFSINILHVIFFLLGLLMVILATTLMFKERLFPADIIIKSLEK
ncbi:MAG: hypothetical protein ACOC2J_00955 [bacterium]